MIDKYKKKLNWELSIINLNNNNLINTPHHNNLMLKIKMIKKVGTLKKYFQEFKIRIKIKIKIKIMIN